MRGTKPTRPRVRSHKCAPSFFLLLSPVRAWHRSPSANVAAKDTALGLTPEGKPSVASVYSKIFTKRIYDNVYANCGSDTACSIKNTLPLIKSRAEIVNYYILQVVAHEMGHGSMLTPANTDGYYHYSKSGTLMDPSVVFSRGVYTIPTNINSNDPSAVALK